MNKPKVGLVTTRDGVISGVTIVQKQLQNYLYDSGYQVDLIRPVETPFRDIPMVGYPLSYALLTDQLKQYNVVLGNGIGLMGCLIGNIPYIDTIHSTPAGIDEVLSAAYLSLTPTEITYLNKVLGTIFQANTNDITLELQHNLSAIQIDTIIAQNAASIITVSSQTRSEVEKYFNAPHKTVTIIPNGVDKMWWSNSDLPNPQPHLIYSGRVGSNIKNVFLKGYDRLLRILETHQDMDSTLLLYNSSEQYNQVLHDLYAFPGTQVMLRSTQSLMKEQMKPGDIFISTSRYEAFGLSFVEAMARGLCVICFPVGVSKEIILNSKNGFIVNSVEEMNALIDELKHDPARTYAIGQAAQEVICSNYSLAAMGDAYINEIKKVLT